MPTVPWRSILSKVGIVLAVLVAMLVSLVFQKSSVPESGILISEQSMQQAVRQLEPMENSFVMSQADVETFQKEGVVLLRGLLTPAQAATVRSAIVNEIPKTQSFWTLFDFLPKVTFDKVQFDVWRNHLLMAYLALQALPSLAAQLMNLTPITNSDVTTLSQTLSSSQTLRLLRDAVFQYNPQAQQTGCGWHVDDEGFWPAKNDTSGVTFWIALDQMRVSEGGGLALAKGSHKENDMIAKCREVIRGGKTCAMEQTSPECFAYMESLKVEYDMEPGDAIVWDRWVFHRSVPTRIIQHEQEHEHDTNTYEEAKMRYSVRYMPGHARAAGLVHSSVPQGSLFTESPYYPQVYPHLVASEMQELQARNGGLDSDITLVNIFQTMGVRFLGVLIKRLRVLGTKQDGY